MSDAVPPAQPPPPERGPGERFMEILGATDDPAERPLPEWRRRLHRFCEVWIFALVVAFFIRHFAVELFRIPSASMEPMLYGDPGLGKGDFVLVDKLTARFRQVQRWDVTVFQYPVPEVESSSGQRARPARTATDQRLDDPVWRPLQGSNFVKRAVLLPGERFYVRGGDVFVQDAAGAWTIARKPPALQERLWLPIYAAGAQDGYLPWQASAASVAAKGDALALAFTASGGEVRFTQPLRNLYLKPGPPVAIRPALGGQDWSVVRDVTMTHPQFEIGGTSGTLWELDRWQLKRLTSADQDDPNRVNQLENALMDEWVGDVQARFTVAALGGELRLRFANRPLGQADDSRRIDLVLRPDGWRVEGGGAAKDLAASGGCASVGATFDVAQVDAQVVLRINGSEVLRRDVAWVDANSDRLSLAWLGEGGATVSGLALARDLHYTRKGFLIPNPDGRLELPDYAETLHSGYSYEDVDRTVDVQRLERGVRASILGKPAEEMTREDRMRAYGTGPDNPARVPEGAYLMMGDNSPHSFDGREWGFVPAENLRGRGWLVVFPPSRWRVIR